MNKKNIGKKFVITSLIQCGCGRVLETMNLTKNILHSAKSLEEKSGVKEFTGPYMTIGQHDIFFQIFGDRIEKMMVSFYALIDTLYAASPQYVRDFVKIIGFTWNDTQFKEDKITPVAHLFIKYKFPINHRNHKKELVIEKILNAINEFSEDNKISAKLLPYGHFSWHEVSGTLIDTSFYFAAKIRDTILTLPEILDVITIPLLVNSIPSLEKDALKFNQIENFETFLIGDYKNIEVRDSIKNVPIENKEIIGAFGRKLRYFCNNSEDVMDILNTIGQDSSIQCMTTLVNLLENEVDAKKTPPKEDLKLNTQKNSNVEFDNTLFQERLDRILAYKSIIARKFEAKKTQIKTTRANSQFEYIIPQSLEEAVDSLLSEDEPISEQTLEFYFREIRLALQHRLAGSGIGGNYRNVIGIFERFGGYQKFILACEALLLNCYRYFIAHAFSTELKHVANPTFLVFFDYGLHHWTRTPHEVYEIGIRSTIPIIVRLPLMKYKPYLWITGLRVLANWMFHFYRPKSLEKDIFYEFTLEESQISFADEFICTFIEKRDYVRILAEENEMFKRIGVDQNFCDYKIFRDIKKRMDKIPNDLCKNGRIGDKEYTKGLSSRIHQFKQKLLEGSIILEVDNFTDFTALLNAYYSLDRDEQMSPKAFSSFTLSLYWMHPAVTKKEIK